MNRVYIYATHGERYALVRGMIRDWLQAQHIPAMWSPSRKGFWVRQERVADVVALLAHDGYAVRVKDRGTGWAA